MHSPTLKQPVMQQDPSDTVVDGRPLFSLATRPKPEPHVWGARERVMPHDSPSGHEQHEWRCQRCPMVKITVLPRAAEARREYRHRDEARQFMAEWEPGCVPGLTSGAAKP